MSLVENPDWSKYDTLTLIQAAENQRPGALEALGERAKTDEIAAAIFAQLVDS